MEKAPKNLRFAVLATDTVLLTAHAGKVWVLLMKVDRPPYYIHHWGAPGGLIHPKETAEESAKRHLWVKGKVKNVYMEQLYTFSRVDRDPRGRVVSVAYLALIPAGKVSLDPKPELKWFSVEKLPTLAYDHREIIVSALGRLRAKLGYTNIARFLLADEFTLGELQNVYEVVLERKLDKRNFRKKVLALGLVEPVKKQKKGMAHRPAALFRFSEGELRIVEIL